MTVETIGPIPPIVGCGQGQIAKIGLVLTGGFRGPRGEKARR
jgi:hypothetical protein